MEFRVKLFQKPFHGQSSYFLKACFKFERYDLKQLVFGSNHVKIPKELKNRHF